MATEKHSILLVLGEPYTARFWSRVEKVPDGCWLWRGGRTKNGYGVFGLLNHTFLAHRVAYTMTKGAIPLGLQIDHLCRVRHCVNPGHLEPVTCSENLCRGETGRKKQATCNKGHIWTHVIVKKKKRPVAEGYYETRTCAICANERQRKEYHQQSEADRERRRTRRRLRAKFLRESH